GRAARAGASYSRESVSKPHDLTRRPGAGRDPLFRRSANGFLVAESSHYVVVKRVTSMHPRVDRRMDPGLRRDDDGGFGCTRRTPGPCDDGPSSSLGTASKAGIHPPVDASMRAYNPRHTNVMQALL